MRILQASPVVYSSNPAISNAIIRNNLNNSSDSILINQQNHNQTLNLHNNDNYENLNGNSNNDITNFITPITTQTFDNRNNLSEDIYNNQNILINNQDITTITNDNIQDNNCINNIINTQNQIVNDHENYHNNINETLYNNLNQLNNIKSNIIKNNDDEDKNLTEHFTNNIEENFNRNLNCCDSGENINFNGNDNDNCRQLYQENLNFLDSKQDNLSRQRPLFQSTEISKNLNIRHTDQFNNFDLEESEESVFGFSDSEEIEDKDDNDVEFTESPPLQNENLKDIENSYQTNENLENIEENSIGKFENINKLTENLKSNEEIVKSDIECDKENDIRLETSEILNDKINNSKLQRLDFKESESININSNSELEKLQSEIPLGVVTVEKLEKSIEINKDSIEIETEVKEIISNNMVKETLPSSPTSTDIINEGILANKRPRRQRCSSPAGCVLKLTNSNRNPDDNLMDDEGGYSTSSPSTFGSLNSSPDLSNNYPRGIINPNYPGFQHLAHTLSEHFVTHPNDPDDSDLSEFEIELSIDDDEKFESINNNNNNNNNNSSTSYHSSNSYYNKNSRNIINNNNSDISDIMLSSISDELNYNLETSIRSLKETREHKEILLPEIRVSFECHDLKNEKRFDLKDKSITNLTTTSTSTSLSQNYDKNCITDDTNLIDKHQPTKLKKKICTDDIDDDDISASCDLETYLQKYETSADIRSAKLTKSLLLNNSHNDEYDDDDKNRNCPTPDILQKSNKNDFSHRQRSTNPIQSSEILSTTLVESSSGSITVSGSENRPDLLRNVCPQTNTILVEENVYNIEQKSEIFNNNVVDVDFANADANNSNDIDDNINGVIDNKKQLRSQVPDNIPIEITNQNDTNKDDISFGITPVDIVGDFGREVEREFGLLVTGYNTRLCRDPSPVFLEHENKFMEKMTDATLSDAKEQIKFGTSSPPTLNSTSIAANILIARATLNQPITSSSSIPCDLVMQTTNGTNSLMQNKILQQTPNMEIDKNKKMSQNNINNEIIQPTSILNLVKQVKQRIPPPPPPRRFLAQQLLQQKEQQLLKQQQQQLNSTIPTNTITNSNTLSSEVVLQSNDTVSIINAADMTNTNNNSTSKKLNTKNNINSNIISQSNSELIIKNSNTNNDINIVAGAGAVAASDVSIDHNNVVATIVPVLESTTTNIINSINNDNNKQNLPTAIVKPKYQKYSYDERQLPPIGLVGFCDRKANRSFWQNINDIDNDIDDDYYDENKQIKSINNNINKYNLNNKSRKNSSSTSILSVQNSNVGDHRIQKLTKKSSNRNINVSQNLTSERDQHRSSLKHYHYIGQRDNKSLISGKSSSSSTASVGINSNYVAIVTPRKKDKFESILMNSSDLKKMNQIYEKNHNNNIKNNNGSVIGTNNYNGIGKYSSLNNINNNNGTSSASVRMKSKRETSSTASASFDVYNIETALPVIDLEAIENHLKKAKEEEKKRRNDREEIRRRLAMGAEDDYFNKIVNADRPGRKPSLQSRLQNGMNLQICFMNDASSDTESPSSDSETCPKLSKSMSTSSNITTTSSSATSSRYSSNASIVAHPYNSRPLSVSVLSGNNYNNNCLNKKSLSQRPSTLSLGPPIKELTDDNESDFFTKQARLQIEARMALAQAKDMAHMQMEIERQKQKQSPITEVIRNSLEKVGIPFPPEKRRVSRQMCTDMNIAQLQIIVNELHTQIERLNEKLVQYLMERDELHMGQDSMLVDIEDLTRYLGAKEQTLMNENSSKNSPINDQTSSTNIINNSVMTTGIISTPQMQSKFQRIASLVKK